MKMQLALLSTAALASHGCDSVDCGEGTIERNGTCMPANAEVTDSKCGPGTMLEADSCIPILDPTVCDDSTTTPVKDPDTGVITCVGTGGGGCDATFACPAPKDAQHQTLCGQIYNLEDETKFKTADATGMKCTTTTADGPCSLKIDAFDALQFGMNPQTAPKLTTDPVYIDDCGRYKVENIMLPQNPFIGLGFDDADGGKMGPMGTTNTVGVAYKKDAGKAYGFLDGYVAPKALTDQWESSGGPPMSGGYYVPIYRVKQEPPPGDPLLTEAQRHENQSGVTFTKSNNAVPNQDNYFLAAQTKRMDIDTNATSTGANGTAIITGATVQDLVIYSGQGGGLDATCRWESHAGASLPFILFVQDFRPVNAIGQTCSR